MKSRKHDEYLRLIPGLIAALMVAGCVSPPQKPEHVTQGGYGEVIEYGRKLAQYEMKRHDVVGLSIALVDDQDVVWAQGFGFADKERVVAATPDTLYRVGSISKLFTTTAAMQLADQGRLDIDAPLETYVPEFAIKRRFEPETPITLRSLMTHHSGLPLNRLKGMWTATPRPFTRIATELHQEYAAHPPGKIFSYSNLGMTLLGHAIQNRAGQPFSEHMQSAVLAPVDMAHSEFSTGMSTGPLASKGYRQGKAAKIPMLSWVPAGGLNSSVNDLSHFLEMIFARGRSGDRLVLQPASLDEMLQSQNDHVALDFDSRVGLAWMLSGLGDIDIRNAGIVAHHSGGTILFHSQLIALPKHKLGIVVLANSAESREAVNKIATEVLKLALEAKAGLEQPDKDSLQKENPVEALAPEAYVGRYATIAGLVSVTQHGDRLKARAFGETLQLRPREDGRLSMQYRLLGLLPIGLDELEGVGLYLKRVSGHEVLTAALYGEEIYAGEKIATPPLPDSWRDRVGNYRISNLDDDIELLKDIRLIIEDELMVLEFETLLSDGFTNRLPLNPVSDTEAIIFGLGPSGGESIQVVETQNGEALHYSGYVIRAYTKGT